MFDLTADLPTTGLGGLDLEDLQIREITEDVVIVSGKETMRSNDNGKTNVSRLRFTDVFKKIGGQWRAVSTHSSPRE
ncbi:nuclear transport factor 2 family protein [Persicitalea sp.]|uniref:nuclear transport factor 2 family protein n=1 Tax=Persicitalea sp. TaxID=3100273 RepID=UPI0035942C21